MTTTPIQETEKKPRKNYYAKRQIMRVMGWPDNDEVKFKTLENYFNRWIKNYD